MIVNGKMKTVTGENYILIHLSIVTIKFRKKCRILYGLFYSCKKKCVKSNSWRHPSWHSKIPLAGFATWCVWPPMWRFRNGHKSLLHSKYQCFILLIFLYIRVFSILLSWEVISQSWILTASHCTDASAHASEIFNNLISLFLDFIIYF